MIQKLIKLLEDLDDRLDAIPKLIALYNPFTLARRIDNLQTALIRVGVMNIKQEKLIEKLQGQLKRRRTKK